MNNLLKQAKAGAIIQLRDGRKWKYQFSGNNGEIWGTTGSEEGYSAWRPDGKWRHDGIESCADLVVVQPALIFEN